MPHTVDRWPKPLRIVIPCRLLEPSQAFLEIDVTNDFAEHAQQVHQPTEQGRVDAAGLGLPIERSQLAPDRPVIAQ